MHKQFMRRNTAPRLYKKHAAWSFRITKKTRCTHRVFL